MGGWGEKGRIKALKSSQPPWGFVRKRGEYAKKYLYIFFFICRSQGPGGETDERGDGDGTGKVCFTVREVNQKWRWFYSKKNGSEMALNLWEEKWIRDGAGSTGENQS